MSISTGGTIKDNTIMPLFYENISRLNTRFAPVRWPYGLTTSHSPPDHPEACLLLNTSPDLITRFFPPLNKLPHIDHRRACDLPQRLLRKEPLVPTHQHIRETHESCKDLILHHLATVIRIEQRRFRFVHVQAQPPEVAGFEGGDHGGGVDEGSARGIDKEGMRL